LKVTLKTKTIAEAMIKTDKRVKITWQILIAFKKRFDRKTQIDIICNRLTMASNPDQNLRKEKLWISEEE
jgi:hypothetical protein